MLRRLVLVRTEVSEERSTSIIRVTRIGELGTSAIISNRCTLRRSTEALVRTDVSEERNAACVGC
jgi:hypothetical protein